MLQFSLMLFPPPYRCVASLPCRQKKKKDALWDTTGGRWRGWRCRLAFLACPLPCSGFVGGRFLVGGGGIKGHGCLEGQRAYLPWHTYSSMGIADVW